MFSLPLLEITRFRRHLLTQLALLTVILIPTVYGGIYLWANWDPTGNSDRLDAAVVNLDEGAQDPKLDAGRELTEKLTGEDADAGFTWKTTDVDRAADGLDSGKYAAVLTIPANFSRELTSTAGDDPERTELKIQTNDANNYLTGKIASVVLGQVRENLNETTTAKYVDQVYVGFNDIHKNMVKAADGADTVHEGAAKLATSSDTLADGAGQLHDGAGQLVDGTGQLHDATGKAVTGAKSLATGIGKIDDASGTLADGSGKLADGAGDLTTGAKKVASGADKLSDTADAATQKADEFKDRADTLVDNTVPVIDRAADDLDDAHHKVKGDITEQLRALQKKYPDDPQVKKLVESAQSVGKDLDDAHDRATKGFEKAKQARKDTTAKADELIGKVHAADKSIGTLAGGARTVADGAGKLHTNTVTLAKGADKLHTATGTAADGAQTLASGSVQLDAAAGKIDTAAGKLNTASGKLADGAGQLHDGATKIDDGTGKLATSIRDGAKEVPTYDKDSRDAHSKAVALPVTGDDTPKNHVAFYGEGMAPMFISIGLWIGGMITYMVLGAIPYRALATSAKSYRIALSGWWPAVIFGCLQVAVLYAFLVFVLDFTAASWIATLLFSIIVTASFHAIHQMCVILFGGIGRLLALVLLILQLGAGSGSYPVELGPGFFQAIAPYLPMTYAIKGLRALISGGDPGQVASALLGLVVIGVVGMLVSVIACNAKRMIKLKDLHPSFTL
ncbi:YhgE/Pip domain-containing protein [Brevibacterium sp. 50QC2O2]|uniref:YhgE/Pip domain-containing protein n=1 Tax=Brevibacterium TaxID=1696 RepID=UPI00211C701E|nr:MULTISPECIES: YhgE/Pip domain-containing protein [unclassified Brevibacterium]MCQ9369115.1 YhgE/Pip domain-containing protein [Brevibacterium sp. 91QC2O2]MCQ9386472.1 YhgE/Pip domain-containing protein [Brevibacterium sp. 68QC2CO]MCQ9387064.1 YhgE/Pip domain-containing protein [Brevibacterium sp. 50QC2O2]